MGKRSIYQMRPIRERIMYYHFLHVLRSNVANEVVGAFVFVGEGTENIMSALKIQKSLNLDWCPLHSMVYCCS